METRRTIHDKQTADKVTRDMLRGLNAGDSLTVTLPDAAAIESGKATAYTLQRLEGCKFSVQTDYVARTLTVTRSEL